MCVCVYLYILPDSFRFVCGICITFLVFDLRVLVLDSLKYRGAHPCVHLKVKSRILNPILFLIVVLILHLLLLTMTIIMMIFINCNNNSHFNNDTYK